MNAVLDNAPRFVLIGCGGAGNKILNHTKVLHFPNIKTISIDTDKEFLNSTYADIHILLGDGRIKAWGEGDPAESAHAMNGARCEFEPLVNPGDIVFLLAGLGGGAGSGATPQIAKIAREKGALTIAIISMPFLIQTKTINNAQEGLRRLVDSADSVIVMDNDRYRSRYYNGSVSAIYAKVDEIILAVIRGIITTATVPCLINSEDGDLQAIFKKKGLAIILEGESEIGVVNTNASVIRSCLSNPPSADIDYRGASASFVLIIGGYDLNRYDAEVIATDLTYDLDPHADVVWVADVHKSMEGRVRVYAIMTGVRPSEKNPVFSYKYPKEDA
jgi:cell division protein FtsZ